MPTHTAHTIWTSKYAPLSPAEMTSQRASIEQLQQFLAAHKPGQICLLHGPQGSGKTSMVHAVARAMDAELLEVNASDVRNESAIMEVLGPALKQRSLFSSTKIILFDEVDGLSGNGDRGGLGAILKLAKETTFPIVMTANDIWDSKFSELRRSSTVIAVHGLPYTSIVPILRRIADGEGVGYSDDTLKAIARRAGGDIRAAIMDLQTIGARALDTNATLDIASVDTLSQRDVAEDIVNAVRVVLKTRDPILARRALDNVQEDIDEIFLWMDENLAKEYRKPEDIHRAYQALSQADVFRGRIRRWQHWRFLVYCYDLLGPGIALAKTEKYDGFTQYSPTQRIFAMWRAKSARRDGVVASLGKAQHISKRQARQELRILRHTLAALPAESTFLSEEDHEWIVEAVSGVKRTSVKKTPK